MQFLDYVFIVVCQMGISGAGLATGIGQMVPAVSGLVFFSFSKGSLHFTRLSLHLKEFMQACYNGSSEMISQLSNAIITFLFNIVMMRLAGEHGVAAITILLYGQFLFNAFYLGFSIGISPIVGFQYGAGNKKELKNIHKISFLFCWYFLNSSYNRCHYFVYTDCYNFTHDAETFRLAAPGFRILQLISVQRLKYYLFRFFYRLVQRTCICNYLILPDTGIYCIMLINSAFLP